MSAPSAEGSNNDECFDVEIVQWHAVASWTWNSDDVCAICHNSFDECHPESKFPGDDSAVAWGKCGHAFHVVCIQRMLDGQRASPTSRCPYCRQEWEYANKPRESA